MSENGYVYLLAGGRPSNRETQLSLIKKVFEGNGLSSPTVAYVGAANGDDESFFNRMADIIKAAGARSVKHALISPEDADLKMARSILESVDIIFVSGGDVEEGMNVLEEKGMIDVLCKLHQKGKPFFGISAGSIMLAERWVRWRNPDDDSTAELFTCLNVASVICDTHGEADRWEELKIALGLSKDGMRGYGIVSGTAIRVSLNGRVEALGGAVNQFSRRGGKIVSLPDILPVK